MLSDNKRNITFLPLVLAALEYGVVGVQATCPKTAAAVNGALQSGNAYTWPRSVAG
jgi:hypothetical protein